MCQVHSRSEQTRSDSPACFPARSLGLLYFTYGIVFACGCSFAYQPSLVILGHYFKKRLGLVNGIVTAGSSIFTITLPFVLSGLLDRVGLQNTLRVLCILMFVLMLAGFTYKPLLPPKPANTRTGGWCPPMSQLFNINIWRSLGYRIWAFGIPAALYGYFVPYVHLVSSRSAEVCLSSHDDVGPCGTLTSLRLLSALILHSGSG